MREQEWGPDTCGCKIIETCEDETSQVLSTRIVLKCADHIDVPDEELYGVLYSNPDGENRMKNEIESTLLGHFELKDLGLHEKKFNKDGEGEYIGFKKGLKYLWSFSGKGKDRVFNFEIKGATLSPSQRKAILDSCTEK